MWWNERECSDEILTGQGGEKLAKVSYLLRLYNGRLAVALFEISSREIMVARVLDNLL